MFGMSKPVLYGLGALILIVAILAFFRLRENEQERHENQLVNSGAIIERGRAFEEATNRAQEAKDAANNPSSDELNRVCDKYDRNCATNSK